jgi:hypothetical protein
MGWRGNERGIWEGTGRGSGLVSLWLIQMGTARCHGNSQWAKGACGRVYRDVAEGRNHAMRACGKTSRVGGVGLGRGLTGGPA